MVTHMELECDQTDKGWLPEELGDRAGVGEGSKLLPATCMHPGSLWLLIKFEGPKRKDRGLAYEL